MRGNYYVKDNRKTLRSNTLGQESMSIQGPMCMDHVQNKHQTLVVITLCKHRKNVLKKGNNKYKTER